MYMSNTIHVPRVAEQECREERAKAAHIEKLLERNQIKLRG